MTEDASSQNTATYIAKVKAQASQTGQVLEKIKQSRVAELDNLIVENEIAKYKKSLEGTATATPQGQQLPSLASLFVGKTPAEIQEILKELSPDDIQKLRMMTANLQDNQVATLLQLLKTSEKPDKSNTVQDTLATIKLVLDMQPKQPIESHNAVTMKDIIEIFRLQDERMARMQQQAQPQGPSTAEAVWKAVTEATRPLYEAMGRKDKEIFEAKLAEVKANMPGPLNEQIEYVREMAGALNIGGNKSEIDLRMEAMKQDREVDLEKLRWEQRKYELEQDADSRKWESITNILQGPIGEVVKNIGAAGADRMRGVKKPNNGGNNPGRAPQPVQTTCPNCKNNIFVDADAETAICGYCGAVLQKQGAQPAPPQPQVREPIRTRTSTPSTRVEDVPARVQPQETHQLPDQAVEAVNPEEEEEEEQADEHGDDEQSQEA